MVFFSVQPILRLEQKLLSVPVSVESPLCWESPFAEKVSRELAEMDFGQIRYNFNRFSTM